MIDYMFYTLVSLGCSYLVYHYVLKGQKTFQFNRGYLLVTMLICVIAPILEISMFETIPSLAEISIQSSETYLPTIELIDGKLVKEITTPSFTFYDVLWFIYVLVSLGFFIRFVKNLIDIIRLTTRHYIEVDGLKIIALQDSKNVSSFFNYMFIHPDRLQDKSYSKSMILHERIHYKHLHVIDIMIAEIMLCFLWFNPFMWMYKRVIVQNHEFIADSHTVKSGINLNDYSQLLIGAKSSEHRITFSSGFNFIQIKNRINMLHQSKSTVLKRTLKITTALLLFLGILVFTSFKSSYKSIVVVVDAAHGGKDPGHLNEKDIVLNISNALAELSDDHIKIITLRAEDEFLSLQERVDFVNAQKPDVLLSLHCNTTIKSEVNGVEVFYHDNPKTSKTSMKYALSLAYEQLDKNCTNAKSKTANFKILRDINCPGVLIELGFLSNDLDNKRLNDRSHQKEVAKALYNGLLKTSKVKL